MRRIFEPVTPETVARWYRADFRMYWSLISKVRKQVGRKRIPKEVKNLIYRMVAENPTWALQSRIGNLFLDPTCANLVYELQTPPTKAN